MTKKYNAKQLQKQIVALKTANPSLTFATIASTLNSKGFVSPRGKKISSSWVSNVYNSQIANQASSTSNAAVSTNNHDAFILGVLTIPSLKPAQKVQVLGMFYNVSL